MPRYLIIFKGMRRVRKHSIKKSFDQYCGSRMFIPDPTTPTKYEGEKIVVRKNLSRIQGSKRLRIPDFGSGSATLVSTVVSITRIFRYFRLSFRLWESFIDSALPRTVVCNYCRNTIANRAPSAQAAAFLMYIIKMLEALKANLESVARRGELFAISSLFFIYTKRSNQRSALLELRRGYLTGVTFFVFAVSSCVSNC